MIRRKASVVTQKPAGTRMPSIRDSPPRCAPLPPTTATCISSTSCRPNTDCSIIAIPPRQPCSVALHWPVESPSSPAVSNLLFGTSSCRPAFPRPVGRRAHAHLRAQRPQPHRQRFVTASPVRRQQHTRVVAPCLRPFMVGPPILRPDPGLAASPWVRYMLKWQEGRSPCLCLCRPLGTDNLLAKRRCATYGGTRRWPGGMSDRPTDVAAEREVLSRCRQGPNAVESAEVRVCSICQHSGGFTRSDW